MTAPDYPRTPRTRLKRRPMRAAYDRKTVHAILDEAVFCHIGHVQAGRPVVIPTVFWRIGERLYWHGARGGRSAGLDGLEVCLTVTHLDGLVLARSAYHHSANYRSVMAFGVARTLVDEAERLEALKAMIEKLYPGRWDRIRAPNRAEMAATSVMWMDLHEVSAKVRAGGVVDKETDLGLPVWAGVAPMTLRQGAPEPCPGLADGIELPLYLT